MQNEIQHTLCAESNGLDSGVLPVDGSFLKTGFGGQRHRRRKVRVEVEVPEALMGEFDLRVQEVLAGHRTRLALLEQEFKAVETRGLAGL
jgi:hypothetical protein